MDGFQAIVIVERASGELRRRAIAYVFSTYAPALAFMRSAKASTVLVEFDVEAETIDFCDAAKALKIPILFSANSLNSHTPAEFGLGCSDVIYPSGTINELAS